MEALVGDVSFAGLTGTVDFYDNAGGVYHGDWRTGVRYDLLNIQGDRNDADAPGGGRRLNKHPGASNTPGDVDVVAGAVGAGHLIPRDTTSSPPEQFPLVLTGFDRDGQAGYASWDFGSILMEESSPDAFGSSPVVQASLS